MYVGVDIGGTNIVAATVSDDGEILKRVHTPTNTKDGTDAVIANFLRAVGKLLEGNDLPLRSIGVGVPGAVRSDIGVVVFSPNLPLDNVDLISGLKKRYGCEAYLGNDANCAVLGEAIAGSGKGLKNVGMITLGTGVGGGFVVNGELVTGVSGAAGEIGHTVIVAGGRKCGCGRLGCWETYSSATGLITTAKEAMEEHPESLLWSLSQGSPGNVDGEVVFKAYAQQDAAAESVVSSYIEYLAIGIVNMINLLEPELICVGGGISNAWQHIEAPLLRAIDKEKFTRFSQGVPQTKIVQATLGNDAGIIGAAMLGRR